MKQQILANLNALVTSGDLGAVVVQDINSNVLEIDFPGYPCAVLGSSNQMSSYEYQQANRRTYRFDILIVQLQDNIGSSTDMEDLRDAISLQFDNNFTLAGAAELGIAAVPSEKEFYKQNGKNFVVFSVTLKATTLVQLTYNF